MNNHTDDTTNEPKSDTERVKSAYESASRSLTDLTIQDTADALNVKLTQLEQQALEHWALIHKFDQAINDLVQLRQQMCQALHQVAKIKAGVFQAQQIAFKTFKASGADCFDSTPLPDPFLEKDTPPPQDIEK
jgi:hypothetical protein